MVRGCLEGQRSGLAEPQSVVEATAAYRGEMDKLAGFLAACCIQGPGMRCRASELHAAYTRWCATTGEEAPTGNAFGRLLERRGIVARKSSGVNWRIGLRLREGWQEAIRDQHGQDSHDARPSRAPNRGGSERAMPGPGRITRDEVF